MGGHILKVELADVKWEVKESEGLIMIISFLSRKTLRSLWSCEVRQIAAEKDPFS